MWGRLEKFVVPAIFCHGGFVNSIETGRAWLKSGVHLLQRQGEIVRSRLEVIGISASEALYEKGCFANLGADEALDDLLVLG